MTGIAAGRLREHPMLQAPAEVTNERGGRKPAPGSTGWTDVTRVRAEIIPLRGSEALRDGIERGVATYRVTIRPRPGVTARHRFVWNSDLLGEVILTISAPPQLTPARDALVLTCQSGEVR